MRLTAALLLIMYGGLIAATVETGSPWFMLGIVAFGIWAMGDDPYRSSDLESVPAKGARKGGDVPLDKPP